MRWMLIAMATVCGTVQPEERATPPTTYSDKWAGHSRDDVIFEFGTPTEILTLSNGDKLLSYHSESVVSVASHGGFAGSIAVSRSNAVTRTVWCERRFEIDSNLTVVRAMIAGDGCK